MAGETNLSKLVKGMTPQLNKGEYVFAVIHDINSLNLPDVICHFKEKEGITIIIERTKADEFNLKYDYVAAWITLLVYSSLEAVGLTAIFSAALAKHGISCNVMAGYYHDHIFVDIKDANKAVEVLNNLSGNYT